MSKWLILISVLCYGVDLLADVPRRVASPLFNEAYCGELKSIELKSYAGEDQGVAQIFNESAMGSPIILLEDYWALQVLISQLPDTEVRVSTFMPRTYWNATIDSGKYIVCFSAERVEDREWGGRLIPAYNGVIQLRLIHKGMTLFVYGAGSRLPPFNSYTLDRLDLGIDSNDSYTPQ